MKKINIIILSLLSAVLLPTEVFGQSHNNTAYDDVKITPKRGQWYEDSYRQENPRDNDRATNSDSFNEDVTSDQYSQPGWMDSWEGTLQGRPSYSVQATHVYRAIVYVNEGQTKQITLPGVRYPDSNGENCVSMFNYQRWYNYLTNGKFRNDVLEPVLADGHGNAYDFENGLVGGARVNDVTPDHTYGIYRVRFTKSGSNVEYLACDVSSYNDFLISDPPKNGDDKKWKEPTISQRCIFEIHDADEIKNLLRNCTGDRFLEEKTIHVPLVRISNRTDELVALAMPANNYYVPGEDGANPEELTISIDNGSRFITRDTYTISGEERVISFNQSTDRDDYAAYAGQTVTITVTKGEYNIARFRLVFDEGVQGVLKSRLDAVTNPRNENYERTDAYLSANYETLTQLNFDFDNAQGAGDRNQGQYYPYPLEWSYSTYGFYSDQNQLKDRDGGGNYSPQWGEYGITKDIPWGNAADVALHDYGYHIYVDANERPGTICELPFDTPLCPATRLYVTAYVKSLGDEDRQDDAGIIFVLKGIDTGENGEEVETVLHMQSSGQIPYSHGDWYQLYFSFINEGQPHERYVLELQNNCASTEGGDFCLDDITIYISPLEVNAKTLRPLCSSHHEAEVEIDINYDLLLDRLGLTENEGTDVAHTGYYSFLDKAVYDRTLAETRNPQTAFEAAVIHGSGVYGGTDNPYYGTFTFYTDADKNSYDNENGKLEMITQGANRLLAFTVPIKANQAEEDLTTLQTGGDYYIVFTNNVIEGESAASAYELESACGMRGEFTVTGPLIINVNGEVQTDAATVCMGQVPLIDINMSDGQGGVVENAVFDWYFGDITSFNNQYTEEIDNVGRHTLYEALEQFRYFYPDATAVTDDMGEQGDEDANHHLYQEDLDLIRQLNEDHSAGGQNPRLTLSASNSLAIRLMAEVTPVVVIPVGYLEQEASICWEPTQMMLYAQDGAPLMDVGRNDIDYGDTGDYAVKIRMAKSQLDILVNDDRDLYVPVRDPRLIGSEPSSNVTVTNQDSGDGTSFDRNVYIEWTDNPDIEVGAGDQVIVGKVRQFTISSNSTQTESRVRIDFNNNVTLSEGYEYRLMFKFRTNAVSSNDCDGNVLLPLIVVPDYEVWTGSADDNWNDDTKWRRADPDDINKTDGYAETEETQRGFVPLRPTMVVIPDGGQSVLYMPGTKQGSGQTKVLDLTTDNLGSATHNIEYDLTVRRVYQSGQPSSTYYYVADVYETNLCNQIHFDVGAEMLRSELLTYNKAWTDVKIPVKQWTLVSTPLNGVYSGDWYTKTSGTETSEYFTDLEFGNDNNRLKPLMTQRSWDNNARVVYNSNVATAVISDATWSSTFNDVAVPYNPGKGFSIHANMGSGYAGDGVMFRFPKSDDSYEGFSDQLSRNSSNFGKLATSEMVSQASENGYEVEVTPSRDGNYIIIGNPFVSHLSAKSFFEANSSVLQSKYWIVDGYPVTGAADDENNWWTSDGSDDALIPPYSAFYAQLQSPSQEAQTITFTADMAALKPAQTTETQVLGGMVMCATSENGASTALLRYGNNADNGFVSKEDVQLLREDGNVMPMVYTVAGSMATNINRIKDVRQVPLGVFAAEGDVIALTFTGTDALLDPTLYDAELNTETPITEGMTLSVDGPSHGRYFIRSRGAGDGTTGITDVTAGDDGVSVYSVVRGQVVVSAGAELRDVRVYSVGGALLKSEGIDGGRTAVTISDVDSGVAIVRVTTADGAATRKITVK